MTITALPAREGPTIRVLVCHHDAATQRSIREILEAHGVAHVTPASDARTLIDKLRQGHFQVLVTGEWLPDLDAWRLARIVHGGRFCQSPLTFVVLCPDEDVAVLSARAAQYRMRVLSLAELQRLPELIDESQPGAKPRLLLIEDDRRCADLACASLQPMFDIDVASDGESGLAAYQARPYDLVLLDLALPGIPGETVLKRIGALDPTQPIVIVTANTALDAHATLVFQGAFDFLVKPFDIEALRQTCMLALEQRGYAVLRAERERTGVALKDLFGRIYAAEHANSTGRNLAATQHLKRALATYRPVPLTDEEWAALISEF
jgi:DNA-binding NtrC family response regulator